MHAIAAELSALPREARSEPRRFDVGLRRGHRRGIIDVDFSELLLRF